MHIVKIIIITSHCVNAMAGHETESVNTQSITTTLETRNNQLSHQHYQLF